MVNIFGFFHFSNKKSEIFFLRIIEEKKEKIFFKKFSQKKITKKFLKIFFQEFSPQNLFFMRFEKNQKELQRFSHGFF